VRASTPRRVRGCRSARARRDRAGCETERGRHGELKNFTGIDSPYEPPEAAELTLDTSALTAEEAADGLVSFLVERGALA